MYELYYKLRKSAERSRSSKINIHEYETDGEVEATSRGEALRKWYLGDVVHADRVRKPEEGDVIKDPTERYFILTGVGIWSLVSLEE